MALGIATSGKSLVEVFASENGETFTIMTTTHSGFSCVRAGGKSWQTMKPKPEGASH